MAPPNPPLPPQHQPISRWWGGTADRGDPARLEAFSDGVMAIAITLLVLDIGVTKGSGESLAHALAKALPQLLAFGVSFLQIGIIWANHHALFRLIERVDQVLLLTNLVLLACVCFLPFPTQLIADYTSGADARTAMLLYGGTLAGCAVMFNVVWHYADRRKLLHPGVSPLFHRDVTIRFRAGLASYVFAALLALLLPKLTLVLTVVLALMFLLGPSPRGAFAEQGAEFTEQEAAQPADADTEVEEPV